MDFLRWTGDSGEARTGTETRLAHRDPFRRGDFRLGALIRKRSSGHYDGERTRELAIKRDDARFLARCFFRGERGLSPVGGFNARLARSGKKGRSRARNSITLAASEFNGPQDCCSLPRWTGATARELHPAQERAHCVLHFARARETGRDKGLAGGRDERTRVSGSETNGEERSVLVARARAMPINLPRRSVQIARKV